MASMTMRIPIIASQSHQLPNSKSYVMNCYNHVLNCEGTTSNNFCNMQQNMCGRLLLSSNSHSRGLRCLCKPVSAVGSGLEASITDPKDNAITLKNAKIVVESQDNNKIQLRVDLPGDETQKVFDLVLKKLASNAPPIPGFRRQKGGKTTDVPKSFLLQILGEERVTKFVIQEIVNTTMADYVKKENLNVKDKKINTTQTAEELKLMFNPGNNFGFNAVVELDENSETETENLETEGSTSSSLDA